MRDVSRFVPAFLLAVGCLSISGMREQLHVQARAPMDQIAITAPAGYNHRDLVVPPEERRIAGMSDYVHRLFQRDSLDPGFSVYVGYYDYQVQGKTIHSPKNCLPGAGWETLQGGTRTVDVSGKPYVMNRYLLANKGAQALVYYWYQGRGRIEASEYKVKLNLLKDAALHGRTEEALVRIVVPVAAPTNASPAAEAAVIADADRLALTAAEQMIPAVDRVMPRAAGA